MFPTLLSCFAHKDLIRNELPNLRTNSIVTRSSMLTNFSVQDVHFKSKNGPYSQILGSGARNPPDLTHVLSHPFWWGGLTALWANVFPFLSWCREYSYCMKFSFFFSHLVFKLNSPANTGKDCKELQKVNFEPEWLTHQFCWAVTSDHCIRTLRSSETYVTVVAD